MTSGPAGIYSVSSVREMDRIAIEELGIPGYTLMTRSGEAAVLEARAQFPAATRWQVFCGAGNNAGDGYVVARLAEAAGLDVTVVSLVDPAKLRGDAAKAYDDFVAAGGAAEPWSSTTEADAELCVDAMLGSGLERDVGGDFADCVAAINTNDGAVLALDMPTGLHSDTGAVMGCAIDADLTVTFVGLKTGLFVGQGPEFCGVVRFADLAIPSDVPARLKAELRCANDAYLKDALPRRQRTAHKGRYGHVLVVGGGAGMPGAARLCGEAALRTGAGLVSIATDPSHANQIAANRPELMPHAIADSDALTPLLDKATVIAFGPGLGQSPWARALFERLAEDRRPCVWDADALNWLADAPAQHDRRVITPHPGEASRLLQSATVQSDRRTAVTALQARYGGVAVLKGAGSLIASETMPIWICTAGNPGMAVAGMGDVLTGIIAALLAQGLDLESAAVVGVEVHARAGDKAAAVGERGLVASDLLDELRGIVNP